MRHSFGKRGGFTLLELMLATTLGAMVIATALGLFGAISRSQRRAGEAATLAVESARLREVIQSSLRQVVVTTRTKPTRRPGSTATAQPTGQGGGDGAGTRGPVGVGTDGAGSTAGGLGAAGTGKTDSKASSGRGGLPVGKEGAAKALADAKAQQAAKGGGGSGSRARTPRAEEDETVPPRLLLEGGGEGSGQRLEVVVAASPWAVKVSTGGSIMPMPEAGGGVRGAFELRADEEAAGASAGREAAGMGPGLAMYWRVYSFGDGPGEGRRALGEARLCGGIRSFEWKMYKTSEESDQLEARSEMVARTAARMPAYAEARVRFTDGSVVNWMFEIGYVLGRDQDTLPEIPASLAARLAESRKAAEGDGQRTNGSTPVVAGPVDVAPTPMVGTGGGGAGGTPANGVPVRRSIFNRPAAAPPPPKPKPRSP